MCFFGKTKYVAAIACLKRALYLDPFEWIISYNLGLVHLNTGQFASAFHFFSASINLKPDFPSSYMYLAITLSRLDDFSNACSAYEKAIEMDSDHMFHLNFAITLFNHGELAEAKRQFVLFNDLFQQLDEEQRNSDPEAQMVQMMALKFIWDCPAELRAKNEALKVASMVKRALCIGCNYPSKAFGLAGAVNDAFLIAETLQVHMGFCHENVCVLHDVYPGQKKSLKVEPAKCPTRVNILQQLQQMVRQTRPGDVLFFSFSGYGLQVDDMDGYQDEGYEEAILPTDFVDGRDGDYSAHSTKMILANHERDVWQEEKARSVHARPRFQPVMEIDNPRKGRLPTRPAMSRSSSIAFCYSAAGHGQTAMEMKMTLPGVDGQEPTVKQHGVLSWCFARALEELNFSGTYFDLQEEIQQQMQTIKILMTFSLPLSKPRTMKVLQPVGPVGPPAPDRGLSTQSMRLAPPVVPPPPPGFLAGNGNAAASRPVSEDIPPVQSRPAWSELVHHNVEGREGSFKVQGASYAPPQLKDDKPGNGKPTESGFPWQRTVDRFSRPDSGQRQLPVPPPPPLLPLSSSRPVSQPLPDLANWPSPRSPSQLRQQPYPGQPCQHRTVPLAGLTAPNLFGGGGPPSLSFSVPGYGALAPQADASCAC
eukprot:g834.t1